MVTRNLHKVQETLSDLNLVQKNINELKYYKKKLNAPNHSSSLCTSVCSMIDTLTIQHSEVVKALILYGTKYQGMDERLASSNNPDYQSTNVCLSFRYINAPEHEKSFLEKTVNQIILGDFSDDETWTGNVFSITAGVFGVDAPMDVRDFIANVSKGELNRAIFNGVSLLPIIGGFGKAISKGVKSVDTTAEIIDEMSIVAKHGSNIVDDSSTIIKHSNNIIDSSYIVGTKSYKTIDGVFNGVAKIDEIAIPFSQGDKLLWKTHSLRRYVLSDNSFIIFNKFDMIDSIVHDVKYLPNFKYIKKTGEQCVDLRNKFNNQEKTKFLKKLIDENMDDLKNLNLTQFEIEDMRKGLLPTGFEVHHKLPLDDGGDNSTGNLILIQSDYHDVFTFYQNTFTKTNKFLENGCCEVVDWVIPTGKVYVHELTVQPLFKWGN